MRFKRTTYGEKGGEGPTRGQTASVYELIAPDGSVHRKRSFHVHSDDVIGIGYTHQGKWYPNTVFDRSNIPEWGNEPEKWVPARRIKKGA